MYKFSYLFKLQTSDNTIVSNEIKCSSRFSSGLDMVDFAVHFTIHATKIGFQNSTIYLESDVLIKLHPPIEIVWSLNFLASMPTLYVKNKMAEASLLPQKEGEIIFSTIVGFLF